MHQPHPARFPLPKSDSQARRPRPIDLRSLGRFGPVLLVAALAGSADAGFVQITTGMVDVHTANAAWGDYDNDGDLDIALGGFDAASVRLARIYRNDAGSFVDIGAGLTGVSNGTLVWGDYDNDSDLDLLVAGAANSMRLYRNDGSGFVLLPSTGLIAARSLSE